MKYQDVLNGAYKNVWVWDWFPEVFFSHCTIKAYILCIYMYMYVFVCLCSLTLFQSYCDGYMYVAWKNAQTPDKSENLIYLEIERFRLTKLYLTTPISSWARNYYEAILYNTLLSLFLSFFFFYRKTLLDNISVRQNTTWNTISRHRVECWPIRLQTTCTCNNWRIHRTKPREQ